MKRKNNFIWIVILLVVVAMGVYYVGRKHNNTKQKHDKNHINSELNKSKVENNDKNKKEKINMVDYSDCFEGISGGAIFYNTKNKEYNIYNKELIETRRSPCSTFKIVSTLIGLEKGVINSKESVMGYDGTEYPNKNWNKNLSLEEAFKESCVWYYKKLIDKVDAKSVQNILDDLKYGNCDISEWEGDLKNGKGHLNGFWLESSLQISPKEQVQTMAKIFEGDTNFKKEHINILRDIMKIDVNDKNINVYGKTGTGFDEKNKCVDAWFVGMLEREGDTYYFAIKSDDSNKEITGPKVKEIAINIIKKYYSVRE
ncbi:CDD family class D beta-lactamase [Clostridioides difficile]|uniref:CDD family class D beta-lactamase n=1 Tax=Clostridioides difficile TaxID=1496 RepID=UPI00038CB771|nr:CDD family class D beta-lactamase [Clostridioides difficile]EGT3795925.1 class D beta-lactamase [Clostridioides difficile]EGT3950626.1 class D beta-lactamase [Clostridioides difficile]EGT4024952.1 class D beta-lactamase [Clostridioides difficile]EGT4084236.1 class D beta-lactamase [Clostridioides difficile]EGT4096479.1 class D beta-lactamase [Clostridioides difficile]